jgi:L-threonylcarbamoyladenylate synthase
MPTLLPVDESSVALAAALLRAGKLVAFPTETVYGLGADATNGRAVAAIYEAKGRPAFNPLIIHVAETRALDSLIEWNNTARLLAAKFWPGPMTLVLPRKKDAPVSLLASAGLETLAVRIPSNPDAQKLLRAVALPIAAPSANASGKLSPTMPEHVEDSLGDNVDLILAGGRTQIGVESTVINLTSPAPIILRPGAVTREQLETILGRKVTSFDAALPDVPLSPGMLASHYAPHLPLRLDAKTIDQNEAFLAFGSDSSIKGGLMCLNLSLGGDLNEAAANLFSMLRELDNASYSGIAVASIPNTGLGAAINDRLRRAAAR